ncbi:hypothetical protein ARMSODRAFT_1007369 [Armillaria solidipes]|uniref:Uncharacterized protein n=1 Tax=Armillaria solidipes TaxID=1076256 RepID=A0A2H3B2V1_9AGAR|nr:hypothetical protein ARMSODRAFT_1007369 [Armillaria solidipes]
MSARGIGASIEDAKDSLIRAMLPQAAIRLFVSILRSDNDISVYRLACITTETYTLHYSIDRVIGGKPSSTDIEHPQNAARLLRNPPDALYVTYTVTRIIDSEKERVHGTLQSTLTITISSATTNVLLGNASPSKRSELSTVKGSFSSFGLLLTSFILVQPPSSAKITSQTALIPVTMYRQIFRIRWSQGTTMRSIPHLGFVARPVLPRRNNTYVQCLVSWKNKGRVRNRVSLADREAHNQNWFPGGIMVPRTRLLNKSDTPARGKDGDPCNWPAMSTLVCRLAVYSLQRQELAVTPAETPPVFRRFTFRMRTHSAIAEPLTLRPPGSAFCPVLVQSKKVSIVTSILTGNFYLAATCCQLQKRRTTQRYQRVLSKKPVVYVADRNEQSKVLRITLTALL